MPEHGMSFLPRRDLLTLDEIVRVARAAKSVGVTSIRLTGGEPLVRRGLPDLVGRLHALGFEDLALTTNGMLLTPMAASLADAGLRRVNISCDSLRPERFRSIRRRGELGTVLEAMDAAERAGLTPLKVNVVLVRGRNDDEILDFAAFARDTGRVVRFIEFMPLDADGAWSREQLVTGQEVFDRIRGAWPLVAAGTDEDPAPAQRFRFSDGNGEIGLVSSVSQPFCGTCNRLRLTADGAVRNCLFSDDEVGVRDVLRAGGTDAALTLALRRCRLGQAARPRDQRPRVPAPDPVDVDDRRLTVARLRLFGSAREAAGVSVASIGGGTVSEVLEAAGDRFGTDFAEIAALSKIWVDGEPVGVEAVVGEDDEVAVLPPVSGGSA